MDVDFDFGKCITDFLSGCQSNGFSAFLVFAHKRGCLIDIKVIE